MKQVARNETMEAWGFLKPGQYLIHDRDGKFCPAFQDIIDTAGVKRVPLPPRSPSLHAFAERWVRSVKTEVFSKLMLFGEWSLRHALSQYMSHFHLDRGAVAFVVRSGTGGDGLHPRSRHPSQRRNRYFQHPHWHASGRLAGGLKVLVVRHRRKYDVTNRLSLRAQEVREHYQKRHEVEEVIRVLQSQLSLEACQVGSMRCGAATARAQPRAQEHHMALCVVAYLVVERERLGQGCTWRQLKRRLICNGQQRALPALERVRKAV